MDIHIHHTFDPWQPDPRLDTIMQQIRQLTQRVAHMSDSLASHFDALNTKLASDFDAITTKISGMQAEIATLTSELTPGATITQAQIDTLTSLEARAADLANTAPPVVTPPADTPPADAAPTP